MIRRFEDLKVWQAARELCRGIYAAARSQDLRSDYPLQNQMKRAAISVASNIAEGFERGTRKQQIEFCYIAKGSAGELRAQLMIARDVNLLDEETFAGLADQCESESRMLSGYIKTLQRTREEYPGLKYGRDEATGVA